MNWFSLLSISFLLCIYPTLDLPKLDSKTEVPAQDKTEMIEVAEFKNENNIKFNFAATKPFKIKKSKEIL